MDGTYSVLSGTFASRYTIERELGRGATASVYLARDAQRGTAVAIKVLRPELAESLAADRFLREIRVNERLHHPHIASVLDSGQHEGMLYFVLPHMEGGSLRQMLQREKQLPIDTAVGIARTIALALDYAHKQGLIHRDVKPENILFTSGQACLADFGIARALERAIGDSTTSTGLVRGTPAYMSPEQASGSHAYDGRSDQYSLACVLYEMLAGVPAFIGATPESLIAMRFHHAPRELRVYRGTVSPALESVVMKALSLSPADRYQSTAELAAALDSAFSEPHVERRKSGPGLPSRRRNWIAAGVGVAAIAAVSTVSPVLRNVWRDAPTVDTTRYLLLPVEGDSALPRARVYDLLLSGLGGWKGVSTVDAFTVRALLGQDTAVVLEDKRAISVARRIQAGRYIRTRLVQTGSRIGIYAALFNATNAERLQEASVSVPATLAADAGSRIADQLLLRGDTALARGSRVLPAVQLYGQARNALDMFDLRAADDLLLTALDMDRHYPQAAMALAQARMWMRQANGRWLTWAELAEAGHLDGDNRLVARALGAMARNHADSACAIFEALVRRQDRDFSRWYSLATCRNVDSIVVRDASSASGWRFRSSYHQAVRAYTRAFQLAPALYVGFQAGGFNDLRQLLFTDVGILRAGVAAAPDTGLFYAYPSWQGDSLLFVPYRRRMIARGLVRVDMNAARQAAANERRVFAEIARVWAAALPRNAATKEAVAISLDMLGDPTAADTIRAARPFAADALQELRLATDEVFLRTAVGRTDTASFAIAAQLAESLMAANPDPEPRFARVLAPVAALLGRCRAAGSLAARSANPALASALNISPFTLRAVDSLAAFTAVGCRSAADTAAVVQIERALRGGAPPRSDAVRQQLEIMLLSQVVRLADSPDSARVARFARAGADYVLQAQHAVLAARAVEARRILEQKRRIRGPAGTADISPDAVYDEARVWLALADTAAAREWLDPLLDRASWLPLMFDSPLGTGALLRAAALRAELATHGGQDTLARKWAALPAALWRQPDAELRPSANRMRAIRDR